MKNTCCIALLVTLFPFLATGQSRNTATEVNDYRLVDGKILLEMVVNGERADFVLDLAGHTAVLPEYVEKLHLDTARDSDTSPAAYRYKTVPTAGIATISTIAFGNNVFGNGVTARVLGDEPYLRELGVAGIVGGELFTNVVLTIDGRRQKITTSVPYRPAYMKLDHRDNLTRLPGSAIALPVTIDGTVIPLVFDTWNAGTITLSPADHARLTAPGGPSAELFDGYARAAATAPTKIVPSATLVKTVFPNLPVAVNNALTRSVLGTGILKEGIISIDFQKQKVYYQPHDLVEIKDETIDTPVTVAPGKLNPITRDYFLEHVYDYRANKEFIFKGDKPVVIDFWATWCGPCMRMLPEMEALAAKYKDRVVFLKVNADKEKELCSMFNIVALPTVFFIPVGGKPIIETGAQIVKYEQIIVEQLLEKK